MINLDQASDFAFILALALGFFGLILFYKIIDEVRDILHEIKVMLKIRL